MKHEVNKDPDRPNPLNGHAVSHKGTVIGLSAILLWGFMAGLVRIVADNFGATLGSALVYTVGGMLLLVVRKPAPISEYPRKYLLVGGVMFVLYEAFISLAIGLASTSVQSLEVSLVNYLWPTLLVLMTAAFSHKKGAVWRAARQYGDACIGLVCDADTIHRIRNGAAWRCTRCAILGWCDTRGGRLVDQCADRQTCHQTHRLSVRFP